MASKCTLVVVTMRAKKSHTQLILAKNSTASADQLGFKVTFIRYKQLSTCEVIEK
jgi:hypothetical protein